MHCMHFYAIIAIAVHLYINQFIVFSLSLNCNFCKFIMSLSPLAYVGCINDKSDRLLDGDFHYSRGMTNQKCLQKCRQNYYTFSGTQVNCVFIFNFTCKCNIEKVPSVRKSNSINVENMYTLFPQYYGQCFCGNVTWTSVQNYGSSPENDCRLPCYGDKQDWCGGHWKLSVYLTGVSTKTSCHFCISIVDKVHFDYVWMLYNMKGKTEDKTRGPCITS